MNNFQHYYNLRQAGYNPHEVGSGLLRTIRSALKGYIKQIDGKIGEGAWNELKTSIQELYNTLSSPHDLQTLSQEIEKHIGQLKQFQYNDRMQDGIRLRIVRMLNELLNHIADI